MDFAGCRLAAQDLADQVAAAAQAEFLGHDAQGAVGGDEIDGLDARVALHRQQKVLEKQRAAGAGSGDRKVLRRVIGQVGS